ncbi:MAG: hypothetical protein R2827_05930 [Bdellovibrionales bacterium]
MMKLVLTILLVTSIGCSLIGRNKRTSIDSAGEVTEESSGSQSEKLEIQTKFNNALALMDLGKYMEAGRAFKEILKKYPNTDLELLIVYNLGGALEGLGRCDRAVKRYRQVVERSAGKFQKLEAKALLRISYSYECLGDDAKVVGTLIDLEKRGGHLGSEVIKAEIPARLAAAYSRIGNDYLAQSYFLKAQEGLKELNSDLRSPGKKRELLSKTLYYMGNMQKHSLDKMNTESYMESQKYLQNYLLMSVELNDSRWSPRSVDEILEGYDKIMAKVESVEPQSVDEVVVREARTRQLNLLQGGVSNLKSLQLQRFQQKQEPRIISTLFEKIQQKEKQFEIEMARVARGTNLTREALEREALMLPGRVLEKPKVNKQ